MRILFRCDGGEQPEIGTGHVVRCLLLGDQLRSDSGAEVGIAVRDFGGGVTEQMEAAGHVMFPVPGGVPEPEATLKTMAAFRPDVLVVDRLANASDHLQAFQREGAVLAVLDDPEGAQDIADLSINAIVRGGGPYEGEAYLVLPEVEPAAETPVIPAPRVFLSFGGFDHGDLVSKAVRAVARLKEPVFLSVAVGGRYPKLEALGKALRAQPHPHELLVGLSAKEFSARLRQATVAVVAGGLTMYDAFRHGVPAIVLSQYMHQAAKAAEFAASETAVYLGPGARVSEEQILSAVEELLQDEARRTMLARRGQMRVDGQGLRRVARLLQVVERLTWDTEFFGFPVGRLWPRRLTPALADLADRRCAELRIRCLYFLCDSTHPASVELAKDRGFQLVDTRITLECRLATLPSSRLDGSASIRPACAEDVSLLRDIAAVAFQQSRFYADPNFSRDAASRLYRVWIEKSCTGYAAAVLVADVDGRAAGFITCNLPRPGWGDIGLIGVDASYVGRGLGRGLVTAALDWFRARGVEHAEVVTQGRNDAALRLYERCGFRTARIEHWFHRWYKPRS